MKVEVSGFATCYVVEWNDDGFFWALSSYKNEKPAALHSIPVTVTVEIDDDFNVVAGLVESLDAQIVAVRNECNAKIAKIEDRKSKFLSLELKS